MPRQAAAMPEGSLETIFAALQRAEVRHLVVGGVAVVLHGHPRFTADLDLVPALDTANARAAVAALSLASPSHPTTEVDLFVEEPFPFEAAYGRASWTSLGDTRVAVGSIPDLIWMKRRAWLALSPRERLAWLEQAKQSAARAIAAARQRAQEPSSKR